ncbi:MAG: glycosyltransferase family 2 protein [Candidatus Omnitrophica bacterium]|nr:glycosyltransferase family 2 protein [Candidatus Omnitrophota bacterium]
MKIPLSVVILAKNEEDNIRDCIGSVANWADEVVIIDDESTDRTPEIARELSAVVYRKKMVNEGIHRNWAYTQTRNEWVLSLDADELVTPELREEIGKAITDPQCHYQAFSMPLKTYIGDYWVQYSGWYPASKIRLFQKSRFRYEEVEVHPRAFVDGDAGNLTKDIIHKGYPDFGHFLASLNRQSTLEAQKWIKSGKNVTWVYMARRSIGRFMRTFIQKRGFKDGFVGFMVAYFASLYQVMSYARYWEMKRKQK